MNRICILLDSLLVSLALAGCVKEDLSSANPVGDRVYTVDEFLAKPELRKEIFAQCANDPGRTASNPNCVNVISAERIASVGTTIPRILP